MKNKGCGFEYAEERDNDLMRAYIEQIDSCGEIFLPSIFKRVVKMPSKRFWVSCERASIVIAEMVRGNKLTSMRPTKRAMFEEIYRRVMNLKRMHPEKTISQLVFDVIQEPAPQFYLTPGSAKVIVCKIRKTWHKKRMQRFLQPKQTK